MESPENEFDVEQNTPEWLSLRLGPISGRINSSEIGKATGLNKWEHPSVFYQQRCGASKPKEMNAAMRKGHLMEGACVAHYEQVTSRTMRDGGYCVGSHALYPDVFSEPDDRYRFGASVDRRCLPGDAFKCDLECKCPANPSSYARYYEGASVQWTHLAQMHLQMAVRGHKLIHYMVTLFDNYGGLQAWVLREVAWSESFWQWMAPRARTMSQAITAVVELGGNVDEEAPLGLTQLVLTDETALPFVKPTWTELSRGDSRCTKKPKGQRPKRKRKHAAAK